MSSNKQNGTENLVKNLPDTLPDNVPGSQTEGGPVLDVFIRQAGYEQDQSRISGIRLQVKPGGLTGLIGPNGAGKSTTIKAIIGILPFADAVIAFRGGKGSYAYVPEQPVYYETLTLWEHLALAAAVNELPDEVWVPRSEQLLERFRLEEAKHLLPGGFSKGMLQKMMLLIGFLSKPDVYIVDEPFIGLDPRATRDFLSLLNEERERGAGILMSTHVLDTAEKICDDFVLIDHGRMAAEGTLDDIRGLCGRPEASLFDCFDLLT
ncbi:ABC transporter ATP-binding protein [Paenibacillus yonginensis]|uniref:ABC transporter ATP-binding protein n=1 Tax=Paenibacillus yonginensis TaxID=1462996 RepID=UPI0009F5A2D3|nr:ABC transporter ATP-binding protein [Paenibacillus yonginensis]